MTEQDKDQLIYIKDRLVEFIDAISEFISPALLLTEVYNQLEEIETIVNKRSP